MREFPAMLCKLDSAPGYANIEFFYISFSFSLFFVAWIISCNRDKYSIRFMIPAVVIILAFFSSKFLAFQKE